MYEDASDAKSFKAGVTLAPSTRNGRWEGGDDNTDDIYEAVDDTNASPEVMARRRSYHAVDTQINDWQT